MLGLACMLELDPESSSHVGYAAAMAKVVEWSGIGEMCGSSVWLLLSFNVICYLPTNTCQG